MGQLGYPSTAPQVPGRLAALPRDGGHRVVVAVDAGGWIVGFVHVYVLSHVESDARAEIGGLVVDAACRSRGVGRALMARAEAWARERGLPAVGLRSN